MHFLQHAVFDERDTGLARSYVYQDFFGHDKDLWAGVEAIYSWRDRILSNAGGAAGAGSVWLRIRIGLSFSLKSAQQL
jgi:hypothetical protein